MTDSQQQIINQLLQSYRVHYDISKPQIHPNLAALCAYHQRDSQYVLIKRAELWANEQHEYLYLWCFDHLDQAAVDNLFQQTLADGEPRVKPHAQHMCTFLTAVVLYQRADADALAKLKKLKKRTDYRLSLHGWSEFRTVSADYTGQQIDSNAAGKKLKKDFHILLSDILART